MAGRRKEPVDERPVRRSRPATTVEARENQLIAKAIDLAERQLEDGTASAQVITHYLKLGTQREALEREKLSRENALLKSRTDQIAASARIETMYAEALSAMRAYSGVEVPKSDDEDV